MLGKDGGWGVEESKPRPHGHVGTWVWPRGRAVACGATAVPEGEMAGEHVLPQAGQRGPAPGAQRAWNWGPVL